MIGVGVAPSFYASHSRAAVCAARFPPQYIGNTDRLGTTSGIGLSILL